MTIAHVVSTFPPYQAGQGNVCYFQARALSRRGHAVTVFTPATAGEPIGQRSLDSFTVARLRPLIRYGNAAILPQLTEVLASFDIVHLHYPFFGGDWFVVRAWQKHRIPFVLTYHQDMGSVGGIRGLFFRWYNNLVQPRVLAGADRVLALSRDHIAHSQIRDYLSKPGKVAIVPNGIDVKQCTAPIRSNIRRRYGIPQQPIICFVGALDAAHSFKRLELLLEAFRPWAKQAHLLIVGDGDRRPWFEHQARRLGLAEASTFVGALPNEDTIDTLKQIDFLVLPSSDTESFGIVLIEAMACGKPVIASDLPGVRSLVQETGGGLLFRSGDSADLSSKIGKFLSNQNQTRILGETVRASVLQQYSWDSIAETLERTYNEVLHA